MPDRIFDITVRLEVFSEVLERFAPHLDEQYQWLHTLREVERDERLKLAELLDLQPSVTRNQKLRPIKQSSLTVSLIAAGLSFLQFLSITEILGVSIQSPAAEDTPMFVLAAVAGLALTFGTKELLTRLVKVEFRNGRQHEEFYKSFMRGDTLSYLSLALVVIETAFAAPGLLALLPPRMADSTISQLGAWLAASLAALVNIGLAWAVAISEIDAETRFFKASEINATDVPDLPVTEKDLLYQIKEQKRIVDSATRRYEVVYKRLKRQLHRLFRSKAVQAYLKERKSANSNGSSSHVRHTTHVN